MRIACRIHGLGVTVAEGLALAADAGFDAVELNWPAVHRQLSDRAGAVTTVRAYLREHHLALAAVEAGALDADRSDQQPLIVRHFRETFAQIRDAGADLVLVTGGARQLENFNTLARLLPQLADDAERLGLALALVNRIDSRIEDRRDLLALFLGPATAKVGLCLDVFDFHVAAVSSPSLTVEHGGRIRAVRIADALGSNPVALGEGELQLPALIRALRELEYAGPLIADHFPAAGATHLARQMRQTRQYLQRLIEH